MCAEHVRERAEEVWSASAGAEHALARMEARGVASVSHLHDLDAGPPGPGQKW